MNNKLVKRSIYALSVIAIAFTFSACSLNQSAEERLNESNNISPNLELFIDDSSSESNVIETELDAEGGEEELNDIIEENIIKNNEEEEISEAGKPFDISMINPNEFSDLVSQYNKAKITTNMGVIEVQFFNQDSPNTVNNFLNLAQMGFYDGIKFHRVMENFMIQAGDPLTKENNTALYGTGGPGYVFSDEINNHKLVQGSFAMANAGPNTNGSQFFIVTTESTPWLDGNHTNFGRVISGMDVAMNISSVEVGPRDLPVQDVVIEKIELLK